MTIRARWMRTLRMIVVAGLLAIALIAAVLGSIGSGAHMWDWAHFLGAKETPASVLDRS
jgi:phage-related minor tail protein